MLVAINNNQMLHYALRALSSHSLFKCIYLQWPSPYARDTEHSNYQRGVPVCRELNRFVMKPRVYVMCRVDIRPTCKEWAWGIWVPSGSGLKPRLDFIADLL